MRNVASFAYKCGYNYMLCCARACQLKYFTSWYMLTFQHSKNSFAFWFSPQEENVFIFFFVLIGFERQTNAVRLFNCLSLSRTKVELNVTLKMLFCYVCNTKVKHSTLLRSDLVMLVRCVQNDLGPSIACSVIPCFG